MEYVRVGDSGLYVSRIILGTSGYGSPRWQEWVLEEEAALPLLKHAFDKGINTWDTASLNISSLVCSEYYCPWSALSFEKYLMTVDPWVGSQADAYSNGCAEEIIGKALKTYNIPREQVVILTKIFYAIDPEGQQPIATLMDKTEPGLVNRVGLSRKHILAAVAESVRRLGTYIDVLQIHRLDRSVDLSETMRALNDVIESGQARYLGASSMAAWEFQKMQNIAERHGWHKFISMQNYYNLLYREEEREMIPYCRDSGVGILPWSPLGRGVLAHAWAERGTKREQTDKLLQSLVRDRATEADKEVVDRVEQLAEKRGVSMASVALAWCLRKGMCPITGLGSPARIDEAVGALSFIMSEEESAYLEEPYAPKDVAY